MIVRLLLLKGCIDLLIVRSWVWVVDPNIINKFSKVLLWCNLVWLVQNSHVTWNITQSILYQWSTVTHYAKICLWYWLLNKTNKVEEMCPEAKVWQNLNRGDSNMKKTHKENLIKWKYRKLLYYWLLCTSDWEKEFKQKPVGPVFQHQVALHLK